MAKLYAGRERRKHKRFNVKEGSFVIFTEMKVGRIKDIGKGGIGFQFTTEKSNAEETCIISIYTEEMPASSLRNLPCKVVYEHVHQTADFLKIKFCGVKFGSLSSLQKERLHYFLEKCTENAA